MIIEIEKTSEGWRADAPELPGSPPVGVGKTQAAAVASLFMRCIAEDRINGTKWTVMLPLEGKNIIRRKK